MSGTPQWVREHIAERQIRVIEFTRLGKSAPEIAVALGITERTVVRDRRASGCAQDITIRPLTSDEYARAAAMFDDGCSTAEVARTLGRVPSTIRRHFPGRSWTRDQVVEHISTIRRFNNIGAYV